MEITSFIDSMMLACGNMDFKTLKPINNFIFHPLFDTEWIKRIENVIESAEKYDVSKEQIAHQIKSTSHIRAQLFFLLLDLKSAKISKQKRLKISEFFCDILEIKAKKDIYGYRSNIVHTYEELDIIMKKEFMQANEHIARSIGELYNAAYHLTNGLYTDFYTDYGAENNGPYNLGKNRILVIKQFYDLRPLLLWPENKAPCKNITIYCIYENVKFSCDAISVHSFYEGDPIKCLVKYRIEIDGKIVSVKELKKIKESIESLSAEQWKRLVGLDNEALKLKGLFQRCYVFKDLFDFLGIDWKPTKEMMQAVKDKEFAWNFWNPPKGNEIKYWRKIADPEVEMEHSEAVKKGIEKVKKQDIVLWLKDLSKTDLSIVGGKGANLGELFEKFPVPNGFCITINAYEQFLRENKLGNQIFPLLKKLDVEDTEKLDIISKEIEKLILKVRIPKNIEKEIIKNYKKLGGFVAVRSSATAEDLSTASFAGQQATFLNVKGEKEVLDAVKKCWASLFTSRAIYYRKTNSFDHKKVFISVVIQEMIDSGKAGVMFTVNPVTKNPEEMIIEGAFGLGEMVVSGQVTPDTFIIDKKNMRILTKHIGDKKVAMIRQNGKNVFKELSGKERNSQSISEKEVFELVKLGKAIEKHYGKPQDIEWAICQDKIYILQSRPITTL